MVLSSAFIFRVQFIEALSLYSLKCCYTVFSFFCLNFSLDLSFSSILCNIRCVNTKNIPINKSMKIKSNKIITVSSLLRILRNKCTSVVKKSWQTNCLNVSKYVHDVKGIYRFVHKMHFHGSNESLLYAIRNGMLLNITSQLRQEAKQNRMAD